MKSIPTGFQIITVNSIKIPVLNRMNGDGYPDSCPQMIETLQSVYMGRMLDKFMIISH